MKRILITLGGMCALALSQPSISQPMDASLTQDGGYLLHIPTVGLKDDPGMYQDVNLTSSDSGLSWTLLSGDITYKINAIESITVVKTSEAPVQIFLKITGYISPCGEMGKYVFDIEANDFKVYLYYDAASLPPPGSSCVDSVVSFTKIIPLPVYGLDAGEYSYSVNGKQSGSFTFAMKNELP